MAETELERLAREAQENATRENADRLAAAMRDNAKIMDHLNGK